MRKERQKTKRFSSAKRESMVKYPSDARIFSYHSTPFEIRLQKVAGNLLAIGLISFIGFITTCVN